MLHYSLWNLVFLLLSSSRTLFLSWVMSLSITIHSTQVFRRISTSGNIDKKLDYNKVGSTGSQSSSTPFQYRKGIPSYSSVPHDCMDAYKASVFSRIVAPPPRIGEILVSFFILYFSWPSVSNVIHSSVILDGGLPAPQFCRMIWHWWVTVVFSSTVSSMLPLFSVLFLYIWDWYS